MDLVIVSNIKTSLNVRLEFRLIQFMMHFQCKNGRSYRNYSKNELIDQIDYIYLIMFMPYKVKTIEILEYFNIFQNNFRIINVE